MQYGRLEPIPGTPGAENTAVTIQSIKEILEAEGQSDLLLSRKTPRPKPQHKGPLQQIAENAALERPHTAKSRTTSERKEMRAAKKLPHIRDVTQVPLKKRKPSLLSRLLGAH